MKIKSKPVEKEAWQVQSLLEAAQNNWEALPPSVVGAYERGEVIFLSGGIEIKTPEGWMTGSREDWMIQGLKMELYFCKPEIFEATYDQFDSQERMLKDSKGKSE